MSLRKALSKKSARHLANFFFDDIVNDDNDDDGSSRGGSLPHSFSASQSQSQARVRRTLASGTANVRLTPPKTQAQREYAAAIEGEAPIVVGCGPAGTGKTMIPCELACKYLEEGRYARIVMVRPAVAAQEDLGYLPGTVLEKLDPYLRPLYDVLESVHDKKYVKQMLEAGTLEACAIGYCRGRTFKNCFVIADEMQNATVDQVKMLLTRIGTGTKLVLTGDPLQHDRGYGSNGLSDFIERWQRLSEDAATSEAPAGKNVEIVRFGRVDIQRSSVIESVLRAYEG